MPLDGFGSYRVPLGTLAVPGTLISPAAYNAFLSDIETALSTAVFRDGQSVLEGDFSAGGRQIYNLADGDSETDAVNLRQLRQPRLADGTLAAPSLAFAGAPGTGFYRRADTFPAFAISGVQTAAYTTAQWVFYQDVDVIGTLEVGEQVQASAGTLAAPGISFAGATDRGLGLRPDGALRFVVGGVEAAAFNTSIWSFTVPTDFSGPTYNLNQAYFRNQILADDGTLAAPGISFESASAKGIYMRPGGVPGFVYDGTEAAAYTNTIWAFYVPTDFQGRSVHNGGATVRDTLLVGNGTEAAPGISFEADPTTGMFRRASGTFGFSYAGAYFMEADATTLYVDRPTIVSGQVSVFPATAPAHAVRLDQTAQAMFPRLRFTGDLNTLYTSGMYWAFDGITNLPAGTLYGIVEVVFPNDGNVAVQVYYPYDGRMPYFRASTGAPANPVGWGAWQQYATRGSVVGEQVYNAVDQAAARAALGVTTSGTVNQAFEMNGGTLAADAAPAAGYTLTQYNIGGGAVSLAAGTYTVAAAGLYCVNIGIQLPITGSTNFIDCLLQKNGATVFGSRIQREFTTREWAQGVNAYDSRMIMVQCIAGDTLRVYRAFGQGNITVDTFSAFLVGA